MSKQFSIIRDLIGEDEDSQETGNLECGSCGATLCIGAHLAQAELPLIHRSQIRN